MRFAVGQMKCAPGAVEANCRRIADLTVDAKSGGAAAVVFPEMADTGYDLRQIRKSASTWNELPFKTVSASAKTNKLTVFCGLSEREEGHVFNSMAAFSSAGELIGRYRKIHLFAKEEQREDHYLKPGNEAAIVKIGNARIGLLICFDLRFPELARSLVLHGAEILVIAAAWPLERVELFQTLVSARAIENQCYVIASNRVGCDGGTSFGGSSCIVDPKGHVVAQASESREEIISADIRLENVRSERKSFPVLSSRRPEIYNW